jgi:hypothetical protein
MNRSCGFCELSEVLPEIETLGTPSPSPTNDAVAPLDTRSGVLVNRSSVVLLETQIAEEVAVVELSAISDAA